MMYKSLNDFEPQYLVIYSLDCLISTHASSGGATGGLGRDKFQNQPPPNLKSWQILSKKNGIKLVVDTFRLKTYVKMPPPPHFPQIFQKWRRPPLRELRNTKNDLAVPLMRTLSGEKAFSCRGTNVWNKFSSAGKRFSFWQQNKKSRFLVSKTLRFSGIALLQASLHYSHQNELLDK